VWTDGFRVQAFCRNKLGDVQPEGGRALRSERERERMLL
jgi:hypothetical protein